MEPGHKAQVRPVGGKSDKPARTRFSPGHDASIGDMRRKQQRNQFLIRFGSIAISTEGEDDTYSKCV